MRNLFSYAVGLIALGLAAPGSAQEIAPTTAQETSTATKPAAPSVALDEIVVTAERRSESLQRAPIAITAVTGDSLRDADVMKPTELTSLVPSLQVSVSGGPYALFYLRGVGNFNGNALSDSAVAFNFNGVFIGRPSSTTGFFYDLDRVEVLKGPQGTLYGRNATGGAINVIPQLPTLGQTEGDASFEYGNYNTIRVDGDLNLPIADNAAIRAAVIHVEHDGYMNDGTDDEDDTGGRLSLRFNPLDSLKITAAADYFYQGGRGQGATPVSLGVDNRFGVLSSQGQAYYGTQFDGLAGRNFLPLTSRPFQSDNYWGISSTAEWSSDLGTLTFVPAYREAHLNFLMVTPGFQIKQREDDDQTSLELRFASNEDHPLRYLIGAFYYNENNKVPQYNVNSQFNYSVQEYSASTDSKAAFGRLTYAITDDFKINAGVRYTAEDKSFAGNLATTNIVCIVPISFGGCPGAQPIPYTDFDQPPPANFIPSAAGTITATPPALVNNSSASFYRTTWRVGADWNITPQNLLYASYETGFKAGGFFFSHDSDTFRPESIGAYTIGSKNRFMDNRLEINVEGFYWDYSDQQISHLGIDSAGAIIFPTQNIGSATMKGGELDAKYRVSTHTLLSADVQYLDAIYNKYVYTAPASGGPPVTGCGVGLAAGTYTVDCSGKQPPNSPRWTLNVGIQQTVPMGDVGDLIFEFRNHFQTKALTGLDFVSAEEQGSYWDSDLSVTFTPPNGSYYVTAFVDNLEDSAVIANTYPPPLGTFVVASLRPPRTFGLRAGIHF